MSFRGGLLFLTDNSGYKSRFAVIVVLLAVSSVTSVRGKHGQCPDCTGEQHIKVIDPTTGKCETCWPCTVCQEGTGSSVQCGSIVPKGTDIHCVSCSVGINFSNSSSTEKCQPCGVCSEKHERVSAECTPSSDVECECENGFYRNKTTGECQSCDSCCFSDADDDIIEKCKEDVEIKEDEQSLFSPSTVITTSSSFFKSTKIHTATTPFLLRFTSIPVPFGTQLIQSTSTSLSSANRKSSVVLTENVVVSTVHEKAHEHGESMNWIKGLTCTLGVFLLVVLICSLYPKFKKFRKNKRIKDSKVKFSALIQNEGESPESQRRIDGQCTPGSDGSRRNSRTVPFRKDDEIITMGDQLKNTAEKDSVQRGIPSSLDVKPSNSATKASDSLVVDMEGENQGAGCNSTPLPRPVKDNLGYSTCITDVPRPVISEICRLLDIERVLDENDYRMLGHELGLTSSEITSLKQKSKEPSFVLLMEKFATKPHSGTLDNLESILRKLERYDVIDFIDKWVQNRTFACKLDKSL